MILYDIRVRGHLYLLLVLLIICIPTACFSADKVELSLNEKYDNLLSRLLKSENFMQNLVCRKKIHMPIETRIPNGGVKGKDIYGIAGNITELRGGYF